MHIAVRRNWSLETDIKDFMTSLLVYYYNDPEQVNLAETHL